MLATLVLERDPLQWSDLPGAIVSWVQDVGGFAAVGLVIWFVVTRWQQTGGPPEGPTPIRDKLVKLLVGVAAVAYILGGGLRLVASLQTAPPSPSAAAAAPAPSQYDQYASICFTVGG